MSQLKLKISTAQIDNEIIFRWVSDFNSMCLLRRNDAHFDGRELIIDAHDISVFIEASSVQADSLLSIHRLKRSSIAALDLSLSKRRNQIAKRSLEEARTSLIHSSVENAGYDEKILKPRNLEKLSRV